MTPREAWIDVTVPIRPEMATWPGETAPSVWRSKTLDIDSVNVTEIVLGAHTGTHVDAPNHHLRDGAGAEALDFDVLMGVCSVVTIDLDGEVTAGALDNLTLPPGCSRLLLRTANRHRWGPEATVFDESFVALSTGAARWLAGRGIRLIGIDYLSVQPYHHATSEVHVTLLEAGIVIVEGLDLAVLSDGRYELICLPLLVPGADGAPARVLVRRIP
jgi:arylformamidase